jgi:5-methylcytosine-specific restriction endonuclease McrA
MNGEHTFQSIDDDDADTDDNDSATVWSYQCVECGKKFMTEDDARRHKVDN